VAGKWWAMGIRGCRPSGSTTTECLRVVRYRGSSETTGKATRVFYRCADHHAGHRNDQLLYFPCVAGIRDLDSCIIIDAGNHQQKIFQIVFVADDLACHYRKSIVA